MGWRGHNGAPVKKTVYLVRHAQALSRGTWSRDDNLRPLSKKGERQAQALIGVLDGHDVKRVISSPSLRCQATVEPLAEHLSFPVELDYRLIEGSSLDEARQVLDEAVEADGEIVLCSHGDVIPEVLWHLSANGTKVHGEQRWAKGSVWALTWDGKKFTDARYTPPPA